MKGTFIFVTLDRLIFKERLKRDRQFIPELQDNDWDNFLTEELARDGLGKKALNWEGVRGSDRLVGEGHLSIL